MRNVTGHCMQHFLVTICSLLICSSLAAAPDIKDKELLEAFMDGVVNTTMEDSHIAGAVVAVMVNGELAFKKGYGYADIENGIPVDPDKTMFRIGSVSKLFTYMSLMQLHEQGKLDLDANIQDYLPDLAIPETFPEPIKVINLFTHTAGFEDRVIGLFAKDESALLPYNELLENELPTRVRKPGLVSSYSNHSLGIAGLIIENISGMSWAEYVRKNILEPLAMEYATAYQPVPQPLTDYSSIGYRWVNGEYKAQQFEYVPLGAAGTMSASAGAMMRFMAAALGGGELDGQRVIGENTLSQMQSRLYEVHPSLNAWMYGYAEGSSNGIQTFGHDGGTMQFFTLFLMIPGDNNGVFVSTNTTGGGKLLGAVLKGLLNRYYPYDTDIAPIATPSDVGGIIGEYSTYRHAFTTPSKLIRLDGTYSVSPGEAGQVKIIGGPKGSQTAIEIEPMVFQLQDKNTKIYFDTDENGQQRMFFGSAGGSFYKLSASDSPTLHFALSLFCLTLMLWSLIAWPVQRFNSSRLPSTAEHRSRVCFWWFSIVSLFILLGIALNTSEELVFGLNASLRFFLILAYLIPPLGLLSVVAVIRLLPDAGTEKRIRTLHAAMGLSAIAVTWMFYYWNLIGLW
jgi:CubicO group peptidase (beta-lactamase class C family)